MEDVLRLFNSFPLRYIPFDFNEIFRNQPKTSNISLTNSIISLFGFWPSQQQSAYLDIDSNLLNMLQEPLYAEDTPKDWDKKKAILEIELDHKKQRESVSMFFEALARKRDMNYHVSRGRYENIASLVEFILQVCENHDDFQNGSIIAYFSQYFCYTDEAEKRFVFLAERLQQLSLIKSKEFWENTLTGLVCVSLSSNRINLQ